MKDREWESDQSKKLFLRANLYFAIIIYGRPFLWDVDSKYQTCFSPGYPIAEPFGVKHTCTTTYTQLYIAEDIYLYLSSFIQLVFHVSID